MFLHYFVFLCFGACGTKRVNFSSSFGLITLCLSGIYSNLVNGFQNKTHYQLESSVQSVSKKFPDNFMFGTTTSAYQNEGAVNEDGRGESIWDRLIRDKPYLITDGSNANISCDSYHKYKEDVLFMKEIGFGYYRFSISWPRILPTGDKTEANEAGIRHYSQLIDELLKNGIEPMVTIYHWDLPQRLQDIGGWMNPLIVDYIEDYADILFQNFGDRVKWWFTINQPTFVVEGYSYSNKAPNLMLDSPANYIVGHNLLIAHGRIYRLYERKYRSSQNGKISMPLTGKTCIPKSNSKEDIEASDRGLSFTFGWFAHPIYGPNGDYPEVMRTTIDENSRKEGRSRSRLPHFTADEKEAINGSFDFFAANYYTAQLCSPGNSSANGSTYEKDINVTMEQSSKWPNSTVSAWQKVVPEGIPVLFSWIKKQYKDIPIFVAETGIGDAGELNDVGRISFYHSHLRELLQLVNNDGYNVIGYNVWTITDNFEWNSGYSSKWGLIHVDFDDVDRKRTLKKSASFFKELLETRTLPDIENTTYTMAQQQNGANESFTEFVIATISNSETKPLLISILFWILLLILLLVLAYGIFLLYRRYKRHYYSQI